MKNKIMAKVQDIEITQEDIQSFLHSLGQQTAMQISKVCPVAENHNTKAAK